MVEEQCNIYELICNFENTVCTKNEKIFKMNFNEIGLINEIMKFCYTTIIKYESIIHNVEKICNSININKQMKYFNNNNNNNKEKIIFLTLLCIIENSKIHDQTNKMDLLLNSKNLTIEIKTINLKIRIKRDISKIKKELMIIENDIKKLENYLKTYFKNK